MSNLAKLIIAIIVVGAIAGGALLLTNNKPKKETASQPTTSQNPEPTQQSTPSQEETSQKPATSTITYSSDGFSPATTTVSSGDSIKFVNNTSSTIDPSSDPHPVHTNNPELNVGDIEPGQDKTITVTTTGTWGYHNHYKSSDKATIIVK